MSGSHHTEEQKARRMRIWKHNTLQGHCAMAITNMNTISRSDTCTLEAQKLAAEIQNMLIRLRELTKERVDP